MDREFEAVGRGCLIVLAAVTLLSVLLGLGVSPALVQLLCMALLGIGLVALVSRALPKLNAPIIQWREQRRYQARQQRLTARKARLNDEAVAQAALGVGWDGELILKHNLVLDGGLLWLHGRGQLRSDVVALEAGSYQLDYNFPDQIVTVDIVSADTGERAFTLTRDGSGTLVLGIADAATYYVTVQPATGAHEWEFRLEIAGSADQQLARRTAPATDRR